MGKKERTVHVVPDAEAPAATTTSSAASDGGTEVGFDDGDEGDEGGFAGELSGRLRSETRL